MKKILIIFILLILSCILIKNKQNNSKIEHKLNEEIIQKINEQNNKIKEVYAEITLGSLFFQKKGSVCYEKENNFKLSIKNKLEIGSNNQFIWFWADHLRPKSLYYCETQKIKQSRLKKIFYPSNIKKILGVCEIKSNGVVLSGNTVKEIDEEIETLTIIENELIKQYLFYENSNLILDINIISYQKIENFILPKKIKINWVLENIKFEITIEKIKINEFIYKDYDMPNYLHKIDISNY